MGKGGGEGKGGVREGDKTRALAKRDSKSDSGGSGLLLRKGQRSEGTCSELGRRLSLQSAGGGR
eukprot:6447758-Pyramimonas_sp.AAC.1